MRFFMMIFPGFTYTEVLNMPHAEMMLWLDIDVEVKKELNKK